MRISKEVVLLNDKRLLVCAVKDRTGRFKGVVSGKCVKELKDQAKGLKLILFGKIFTKQIIKEE